MGADMTTDDPYYGWDDRFPVIRKYIGTQRAKEVIADRMREICDQAKVTQKIRDKHAPTDMELYVDPTVTADAYARAHCDAWVRRLAAGPPGVDINDAFGIVEAKPAVVAGRWEESQAPAKSCSDCKSFTPATDRGFTAREKIEGAKCALNKPMVFCSTERSRFGLCGPSATKWEAKPAAEPPIRPASEMYGYD